MPQRVDNHVNIALASAFTNDRRGVVSYRDEHRIVGAALSDIAKSKDPQKAYDHAKRALKAAEALLGTGSRAGETLGTFANKGRDAITVRLEQLTGSAQLPLDVKEHFADIVKWNANSSSDAVTMSGIQRDGDDRYVFQYAFNDQSGTAYAVKHQGSWILSPKKLSAANLAMAMEAMLEHFDEYIEPTLRDDWDMPASEIAEMRQAIGIEQVYVPFESSDPYSFTSEYPLVFSMSNPTGSDEGYFAGINPQTGEYDAYTFN